MAGTMKKDDLSTLDRLELLVREELSVLGQVDALSQRQSSLVELDDASTLVALLDERQGLIERAASLASEVSQLRDACAGSRNVPATRWSTVEKSFAAVADLAERIATRDRADAQAMARTRDELAAEMGQLDKGRGASAAYGNTRAARGPKYQDRQG